MHCNVGCALCVEKYDEASLNAIYVRAEGHIVAI